MKKGFTLIELLAVIVILAIIALIATPIVLNIIADTRENAKIRSAELYLTAIEQAIIRKKMSDTSFNPNNCYNEGNKIKCDGEELQLDIDGENPDYINVALENGKITTSIIEYENKYTVYENGEKTIKEETPVSCFKYIGNNCTINQEVCQNVYDGEYCESTCADIQSMEEDFTFPSGMLVNSIDTSDYIIITGYRCSTTDVVIPKTIKGKPVTQIDDYVFEDTNIESVIIPNSVTSIGESAFAGNQLTSVTIPNSVTSIGEYAFEENQNLTSITIPSSVTSMGKGAFAYNTNLTRATISSGVTGIGDYVFYESGLTNVTIPSSVTSIGESAFEGNQLTSVTIPSSVTTIDSYAFYDNSLTSVIILEGADGIGMHAFAGNQLTSVTIPSSVTRIDPYAFYDNPLTSVIIKQNEENMHLVDDEQFGNFDISNIKWEPVG